MRDLRTESGAAAVEFAIVSMLLVTLLFGIMEFGYAFFIQGNIAGAAREAARTYAIGGVKDDAVAAAVSAGSAINPPVTASMVNIPDDACPMAPPAGSTPAVTVTIKYPYGGITGGFFFDASIELKGTGTMRCNG